MRDRRHAGPAQMSTIKEIKLISYMTKPCRVNSPFQTGTILFRTPIVQMSTIDNFCRPFLPYNAPPCQQRMKICAGQKPCHTEASQRNNGILRSRKTCPFPSCREAESIRRAGYAGRQLNALPPEQRPPDLPEMLFSRGSAGKLPSSSDHDGRQVLTATWKTGLFRPDRASLWSATRFVPCGREKCRAWASFPAAFARQTPGRQEPRERRRAEGIQERCGRCRQRIRPFFFLR